MRSQDPETVYCSRCESVAPTASFLSLQRGCEGVERAPKRSRLAGSFVLCSWAMDEAAAPAFAAGAVTPRPALLSHFTA